ncbi:restriction endonuclease [Streptomyces europaeiscabiei]|uniref:restriction endonuclease n=1 Tax=Streptomyces europaeiscabiei TaxID=146819 RepID=UPI0029AD6B01|nr:restriction endonuclease [Streptomyces europaeiscabiei]MDX3866389.1 restriction endonuclease [Streptomyces europaeiscabiei]MDX3876116.1 restriction endonuclease [Streptomyces europaeiscabiei]
MQVAAHSWWTALIFFEAVVSLIFINMLVGKVLDLLMTSGPEAVGQLDEPPPIPIPALLTYKMRQLEATSPTGFEYVCTELLARDGFVAPRRVGGAGDLGADIMAIDHAGLTVVVQCKQP